MKKRKLWMSVNLRKSITSLNQWDKIAIENLCQPLVKQFRKQFVFEIKFVRLEYTCKNSFSFSYFRHTGQWFLVATGMTLKDCLEMMQDNPNFQPVG